MKPTKQTLQKQLQNALDNIAAIKQHPFTSTQDKDKLIQIFQDSIRAIQDKLDLETY